jgi:hypothetical protein
METLPPNSPVAAAHPPKPSSKAKPPVPSSLQEFVGTARVSNPRLFLRKISKGAFSIPSSEESRAMAREISASENGALRLLALLQALSEAGGSIRESILALAEDFLRERSVFPMQPLPLPPNEWRAAIVNLVSTPGPKGTKPNLNVFGIFLVLAFHRNWLTEVDIIAVLQAAFPTAKAKRSQSGKPQTLEPSPAEIILGAPFKKPSVAPLLTLNRTWRQRTDAQAKEISQLQGHVRQLEDEKATLAGKLEQAQARITELESALRDQWTRIEQLERELTDTRTAAQHRYDALKGRIRGFLEGELLRWLQNASEAASVDPPRLRVVQERLQSALSGIQKETQCLQSLD